MSTFVTGLAAGIIVLLLVRALRSRDITLKWYEWLLGALGLFSVVFGVQYLFGSLAENYTYAGVLGLVVFGIQGLILLAITWVLVRRRQGAAG